MRRSGGFALSRMGLSAVVASLSVVGCGGAQTVRTPPPAPPASAAAPALAVPSDLDVVIRIDLEPMRAVLPGAELRLADAALGGAELSSASEVVRHSLRSARQVWIGWRPGPTPEHWDNVIVLRGDFSSVGEKELQRAFHPAEDLGGGWRTYAARDIPSRAAPARIYAHLEDLWIVSSSAEIDAVDRILEGRAEEKGLEPPERGVISVAARLSSATAQLRGHAPKAAQFLRRARTAKGSADLTSSGLDVSAELEFEEETDAERAAQALLLLLKALALQGPSWLDEIKVSNMARIVGLRARIPHQALSEARLP